MLFPEGTMDKILLGIASSDNPVQLKRELIKKVADAGSRSRKPEEVKAVLTITTKWMLEGEKQFEHEAGMKVFAAWAQHHKEVLNRYFDNNHVLILLDRTHGNNGRYMVWLLHQCLVLLQEFPRYYQLCQLIEAKAANFVMINPQYQTVISFCNFLMEFKECIPQGEMTAKFCESLVHATSTFSFPNEAKNPAQYIENVSYVGRFLEHIWKHADRQCVLQSLKAIFQIISHIDEIDPSIGPSPALGGIVQYIPTDLMSSVTKNVVTDPKIHDKSMKAALMRMLDWLGWPLARNIDHWVIALLSGLAAVHKFTILIEVTEAMVDKVYDKLQYPVTRQSAMNVLCHMLLSFQHSPEAFHKIAGDLPRRISILKRDGTPQSQHAAAQLAELVHCMMTLYPGFPDLYEPILDVIKDLPRPDSEKVKKKLNQSKWTAQTVENFSYISRFAKKSDTGKTGLVNLGNTCYMNSVIQALFMCDGFRGDLLAVPPSVEESLIFRLQIVFAHLLKSQRAAYAPTTFLQDSRPPWFSAGYQQDCSEYLKYLLDQVHEQELSHLRRMQNGGERSPQSKNSPLFNADNEQLKPTLIQRTFGGKCVTSYRCLKCKNQSAHTECFMDIPLAFPDSGLEKLTSQKALAGGSTSPGGQPYCATSADAAATPVTVSLQDLLAYYLKPERLEGDNKYHCQKCKNLQEAERTLKITHAPNYLIVTLLRFSYDIKTQSRSKISTDVRYPKTLHLPVTHGLDSPKSPKSPKERKHKDSLHRKGQSPEQIDSELYALCGVIMHSGLSSDCGHYYCYARSSIPVELDSSASMAKTRMHMHHPDFDYLQDVWYQLNDSRVSYANYSSFCNVTQKFAKDTAYVLFYQKLTPELLGQGDAAALRSQDDVTLRRDLLELVGRDNTRYLQEQEEEARLQAMRQRSMSNPPHSSWYNHWGDPDDRGGPPGSCGGGGGGIGGFDNSGARFVY